MQIKEVLSTFIYYLIHPFKSHDQLMNRGDSEGELLELSVYESLGTSWVFVVLNGLFRILLLNIVLLGVYEIVEHSEYDLQGIFNFAEIPGYSFFVLSAILDVIFYPLFGIFLIQYWEFVIKLFGRLLNTPGDLAGKAQAIISVSLASQILKIVPIFGAPAQSIARIVLMYAGLRKQLNASSLLCFCIIFSPAFLLLFLMTGMMAFYLVLI